MDIKQRILNRAEDLFLRYGIKSVTMDDIARELGISKKTLYQFVENKTDLIQQIFNDKIQEEKELIAQIRATATDAIDEMMKIAKHAIDELRKMTPTIMYDLQKYYKSTWKMMESLHQKHIYIIIKENLIMGMQQGVYRSDMNPDVVAKLYVAKTSFVADEELFPMKDYNLEDLFREFIIYHIHGIASPKGLQLLSTHVSKVLGEINE